MTDTKRQYFPSLCVVATPIGNLSDLSTRAREVLQSSDTILCEDTRRTAQLMAHLGLHKRLERFDAYSKYDQISKIVGRLTKGEQIALVTDAGTPGISDPAATLVAAARHEGVIVVPVPGPSAVISLLSVSGFNETAFTFCGFFPKKIGDRKKEIKSAMASEVSRLFVWFESPERICDSMNLFAELVAQSEIIVGKELTKIYERFFYGNAIAVAKQVQEEITSEGARGEWCFAVHFPPLEKNKDKSLDWVKTLQCLIDAQVSAPEAARQISQHFGASRKEVYEYALKISGKKNSNGG